MRKKKTFEYTSYFAAEFNGFLQYRISGGSNGLEERRVLYCESGSGLWTLQTQQLYD